MLSIRQKQLRVIIYGTLGTACIVALIAALALPDLSDAFEAQVALSTSRFS